MRNTKKKRKRALTNSTAATTMTMNVFVDDLYKGLVGKRTTHTNLPKYLCTNKLATAKIPRQGKSNFFKSQHFNQDQQRLLIVSTTLVLERLKHMLIIFAMERRSSC